MARNSKSEFLKFLKFDSKLNNSIIAKYLTNPRLVILVLLLILGVGINAFLTLPRNLNPEVKIPIVLVSTVLPGASPADVEQLVTVPIEDAINSLDGVKSVTSNSSENVSIVNIEFNSGIDPEKAKTDVQSAIDSVGDLPDDAQDPNVIKLDFENAPVWTFVLKSNKDEASLFKFAKNLSEDLENLPEIDNVEVSGLEETEIQIVINPQAYLTYGLNPQSISQAVSTGLRSFPVGNIRTETSTFSLAIDPQVITIDDIRNLNINVSGQTVLLGDIATISESPKPDQPQSFIADGNDISRALTFNVFRVKTVNIDKSVEAARKTVDEEVGKFDKNGFEAVTLLNTSEEIDHQFKDLTRDFLITVILVVAVLFIFLGPRQAIVSSLSAPLSFLITFIVMQNTGITLNFLSLFSLILSLGLLVDDTVVVISAMSFYYKTRRFTPVETGLLVWRDFLVPVFTTTITTVWAFLPLLLASGIIGEFIKSIPIVVSTALIASFFVGMFITLPLTVILLKPNVPKRVVILLLGLFVLFIAFVAYVLIPKGNLFFFEVIALLLLVFVLYIIRLEAVGFLHKTFLKLKNSLHKNKKTYPIVNYLARKNFDEGIISFEGINHFYKGLIEKILVQKSARRMVIVAVVSLCIFSFALVPFGFVKSEFFPKTDQDIVYVSVEYPAGTYIEIAKKEGLLLLDKIKDTKDLDFVSLDLGRGINTDSGGTQSSQNSILFSLHLREKRSSQSFEVADSLRKEFVSYNRGKLNVIEQSGGPPVGADVQIKLLGDDLSVLDKKANEVMAYLEQTGQVANVEKTLKPGTGKLTFVPDKALLADNNVSLDQIGGALRLYASGLGFEKNKFPGDTTDKDITLRFYNEGALVETLSEVNIPTQNGVLPISVLGSFSLKNNPTLITREEGKRTVSISGTVRRGFNAAQVNQDLQKFADSKLSLPGGYTWKTGGANEQNQESVNSILQAMILSFMLIIITMVLQFSSFRRAVIVMLVIPLSISGVFIIFALTNTPLSFPALIGVLALFGIVVKNSILVVDKIVENQKQKQMSFVEAIAEASASRLEPITLTSLATILGLIPITLTDPLWRGLGGAIIAGLTVSGMIMLLFIPVVYYNFFNIEKNKRH